MTGPRSLFVALISLMCVLFNAGNTHAAYQLMGSADGVNFSYDGTSANRLLRETPGQYQFDYGDNASVTFSLPWAFPCNGQSYSQLTASADGRVQLGGAGGPVIRAWQSDLSSYFYGGVFVQRKSSPDRVVIEWRTESFVGAGSGQVSAFEVVLTPAGVIRLNYFGFAQTTAADGGSGIDLNGDGVLDLSLSAFGAVPTLAQRSFVALNDPQGDSDGDHLSNLGEYLAQTDPNNADSDGDGTPDGWDPDPLDPLVKGFALALGASSLPADQLLDLAVTMELRARPGETVLFEQLADLNGNGQTDGGEPVVRAFSVTDGVAAQLPNRPGDGDSTVNGVILTRLDYRDGLDRFHSPGDYLVRASSSLGSLVKPLRLTSVIQPQSISGTVSKGAQPSAGVYLKLQDKWRRTLGYALTDSLGRFELQVRDPGTYSLVPLVPGYVLAAGTPAVQLGAGQLLNNVNLAMVAGTHAVSGRVLNSQSGQGLAGVLIEAVGTSGQAETLSAADGSYAFTLPAGSFEIAVSADPALGASAQGFAAGSAARRQVSVAGAVVNQDLSLTPAATLVSGRVVDNFGLSVAGLPLLGKDAAGLSAAAVADAAGNYALTAANSGSWSFDLSEAGQLQGYVGTPFSLTPAGAPLTGRDLTVRPIEAWVAGTVRDPAGQPLANLPVTLQRVGGSEKLTQKTATDGSYRLGAFAANWSVRAATEERGYLPATAKSLTLAAGQTASADFTAAVNTLPDFVVSSVSGPSTVVRGNSIAVTVSVQNQGANFTQTSYGTNVYLSTDASITTGDLLLGSLSIAGPHNSGTVKTATLNVTIPASLAEGTYVLGAIADAAGQIAELNETNNAKAGNTLAVTAARPDLTMTAVSGTLSGSKLTFNTTVKNIGTLAAGAFRVGLYLSTDPTITTGDILLGTRSLTSLGINASSSGKNTITLPKSLPKGTYYVGAIADYAGVVAESNEGNNTLSGNTIIK